MCMCMCVCVYIPLLKNGFTKRMKKTERNAIITKEKKKHHRKIPLWNRQIFAGKNNSKAYW